MTSHPVSWEGAVESGIGHLSIIVLTLTMTELKSSLGFDTIISSNLHIQVPSQLRGSQSIVQNLHYIASNSFHRVKYVQPISDLMKLFETEFKPIVRLRDSISSINIKVSD
jgi:hypothetical protein